MKFLLFATALPCLVAGPVLSQSNSDPPSDYLAPRKIVFETGPEVHSVVVFDTIPRVDPTKSITASSMTRSTLPIKSLSPSVPRRTFLSSVLIGITAR